MEKNELKLTRVLVGGYHRLFCDANNIEEAVKFMFDDDSAADMDFTEFGEVKRDADGEILNFDELEEKAFQYYLDNADKVAKYGDRQGLVRVFKDDEEKFYSDADGEIKECPKIKDGDDYEYYVKVNKNGGKIYLNCSNPHIEYSMYDVPEL